MTALMASRPTAAAMPWPISLTATASSARRSALHAMRRAAPTRAGMERSADIMVRSRPACRGKSASFTVMGPLLPEFSLVAAS